jgi:transcriptional antiterminator NusG
MKSQWFVLHTLSGQELKVKESIEKRVKAEEMGEFIEEVLVPMERVAEVRGGKKSVTTRKLYPGYVFILMILLDENQRIIERPWYFIRDTQGIIGFIGGEHPVALSPGEVEDMLVQCRASEEGSKPKVQFQIGESITIRDGAFENFEGVIENVDADRGKLRVSVTIFGRSTPVEVEYWQVERT